MKYCIFSDVHGNSLALNKMIEIENNNKIDKFIFLGDIFGYFNNQSEVFKTLISIENLYSLLGNHDNNYLLSLNDANLLDSLVYKYGSSYRYVCSNDEIKFLNENERFLEIHEENLVIGFFHGGPNDYLNDRIYPDSIIMDKFLYDKYDIVFLGNTHYRMNYNKDGIWIVNPGSLGQPRDNKGFSYCIFDTNSKQIVFKNVEIDISLLINIISKTDYNYGNYKYLVDKYWKDII